MNAITIASAVCIFLGGVLTGMLLAWLILRINENDIRKQSKQQSW